MGNRKPPRRDLEAAAVDVKAHIYPERPMAIQGVVGAAGIVGPGLRKASGRTCLCGHPWPRKGKAGVGFSDGVRGGADTADGGGGAQGIGTFRGISPTSAVSLGMGQPHQPTRGESTNKEGYSLREGCPRTTEIQKVDGLSQPLSSEGVAGRCHRQPHSTSHGRGRGGGRAPKRQG